MVDWDKDHADLSWTKPENDGGAPITGYVIEYKVTFENHVLYLNGNYIFLNIILSLGKVWKRLGERKGI